MTSIHHSACIFTAYRRVNHSILLTSHQYKARPESEINYLTSPPPTLLLFSIYHEYEIHDVDYIPDYRTAISLL